MTEPKIHTVEIMDGLLDEMVEEFKQIIVRETVKMECERGSHRPYQDAAMRLAIHKNSVTRIFKQSC